MHGLVDVVRVDGRLLYRCSLTPGIYRPLITIKIKMALSSTDPRPARLDPARFQMGYNAQEGMNAFVRVAGQHGWIVPPSFKNMMG